MKTKIYQVSFTSFTESDNYLYNDVKTFTDEEQARQEWEQQCENAYQECRYGSEWDSISSMDEEDREDVYEYDVDEERDPGTYTVSSEAYEGYKVIVSLDEVEIDVPMAQDMMVLCSVDEENTKDMPLCINQADLNNPDVINSIAHTMREIYCVDDYVASVGDEGEQEFQEAIDNLANGRTAHFECYDWFWERVAIIK